MLRAHDSDVKGKCRAVLSGVIRVTMIPLWLFLFGNASKSKRVLRRDKMKDL